MRRVVALAVVLVVLGGCAGGTTASRSVASDDATSPGGRTATDPPEATASAGPTEPPAPAFEEIVLTGTGNKVAEFEIPETDAAIAVLTHNGESNFIVHGIDAAGETLSGLVNAIGDYSGTVLFDTTLGHHTVAFDIAADGAWTITVKPVTAAPVWVPTTNLQGAGDSVYQLFPASRGLVTLDLTHKGVSNFIVHAHSVDGLEVLVNDIGDFSGQVLLPDLTFMLVLLANGGTWTVSPA